MELTVKSGPAIYTPKECEQWLTYDSFYPSSIKMPVFDVEIDNQHYLRWHIADIDRKSFFHDQKRIQQNFELIVYNFPQAKDLLDGLKVFNCPKPSADTCNACASNTFICFFARSTQIPWCMTDYIVAHELGHVVEGNLCARFMTEESRFRDYLALRGAPRITGKIYKGDGVYEEYEDFAYATGEGREQYHSEWDTDPSEWFAEDFRYLFGTDQGQPFWGMPIPPPDERVREFFLSL